MQAVLIHIVMRWVFVCIFLQHIDSTIDGWHHPVAAAAAAAAAAVGLAGGGGGGAGGGWAFDPCRPIGAGYTNYGSIRFV